MASPNNLLYAQAREVTMKAESGSLSFLYGKEKLNRGLPVAFRSLIWIFFQRYWIFLG